MGILKNARHERFAQFVASGKSQVEAYKLAGYSAETAESNAHALMENHAVKARLFELQTKTAEKLGLKREDNLEHLKRIRDTDLPEIVKWDGKTLAVEDFDKLTPAQRSAIESFEVEDTKYGRRIKVKLKSSQDAVKEINDMLGFRAPKKMQVEDTAVTLVIHREPKPVTKTDATVEGAILQQDAGQPKGDQRPCRTAS